MVFGVVVSAAPMTVFAADASDYTTTNVLEDLQSSTVGGKPFNINAYPYDENGEIQVVSFVLLFLQGEYVGRLRLVRVHI